MALDDPTPPPAWVAPVAPVAIVRPFHLAAPYAAGGHRGLDLRANAGAVVRAPCGGRITFRGSVGGGPPTVTVDCGALRATLQRLEPSVALGERARRGAPIGRALGPALDLSARNRDGTYRDPALLLAAGSAPPAPVGARPRRPRRPPSTSGRAQSSARLSDRALVRPPSAAGPLVTPSRPPRADRVLGGAGVALGGALTVAWLLRRHRRGWGSGRWWGSLGLARVRR